MKKRLQDLTIKDTIMHRWIWMHYLQEKVMTSWQIHMSFLSVTLILLEIVCIGIR